MRAADPRAVLGIDPTSRGLAFAFFEEGNLLDWGTRRVEGDDLAALDRILALCPAEVIAIEDVHAKGCLRRARVKRLLAALAMHAKARGMEVRTVPRERVLRSWMARQGARKDTMAQTIASEFPVLDMVLPRARGKYRSEVARTAIFDAASFAIDALGASSESFGE